MIRYEIRVQGQLDGRWPEWFDGMTIMHMENGDTALFGTLADQAALHGVLAKVRDLGLPLLSVVPVAARAEGETACDEPGEEFPKR